MIFFVLPFLFIPFIINFEAGLVLYWATTNLWTVGQGVVTRRLVPRTKVTPQKKSSRTPPKERATPETATAAVADEPRVAPEPAAVAESSTPAAPRRVKKKKKRGGRR